MVTKALNARTSAAQRRERFIAEYLAHGNGTKAAINAGFSAKTAHVTASKLLREPKVAAAITAAQKAVFAPLIDRYKVDAERVTRELALLGFANMGDYITLDENGAPFLDLSEIDSDQAAAITSVKTKRVYRTIGDVDTEEVHAEIKLADKRAALVDLGKITGLFRDGIEVNVPVQFIVTRTSISDEYMRKREQRLLEEENAE